MNVILADVNKYFIREIFSERDSSVLKTAEVLLKISNMIETTNNLQFIEYVKNNIININSVHSKIAFKKQLLPTIQLRSYSGDYGHLINTVIFNQMFITNSNKFWAYPYNSIFEQPILKVIFTKERLEIITTFLLSYKNLICNYNTINEQSSVLFKEFLFDNIIIKKLTTKYPNLVITPNIICCFLYERYKKMFFNLLVTSSIMDCICYYLDNRKLTVSEYEIVYKKIFKEIKILLTNSILGETFLNSTFKNDFNNTDSSSEYTTKNISNLDNKTGHIKGDLGIIAPTGDNGYTLSFDNTIKVYKGNENGTETNIYGDGTALKSGGQIINYQIIGNKIILAITNL
jgi:hypothetical protein